MQKAIGFDGYNGCLTGDKEATLGVNCGMSTGRNGVIVMATIEGNGQRPSHKGLGINWEDDKMYTINATEVHAVAMARRKDES